MSEEGRTDDQRIPSKAWMEREKRKGRSQRDIDEEIGREAHRRQTAEWLGVDVPASEHTARWS